MDQLTQFTQPKRVSWTTFELKTSVFEPKNSYSLSHNYLTHLSHSPMLPLLLGTFNLCADISPHRNSNAPAGVGAPQLNTQQIIHLRICINNLLWISLPVQMSKITQLAHTTNVVDTLGLYTWFSTGHPNLAIRISACVCG